MKMYNVMDPVYSIPIQVFKGVSLEDFEARYTDRSNRKSTEGRTHFHKGGSCLIWISDDAGPEILVHELFHAIHIRLKGKGISPMNLSGEETYAYVLAYFYKEFNRKGLFKKKTVRASS